MVAASKMRKAQEAALAARPFVRLLYRMQRKRTTRRDRVQAPAARSARRPQARGHPRRRRQGPVRRAQHATCFASPRSSIRRRPSSSPPAARRRSSLRARGRQLAADFAYGDSPHVRRSAGHCRVRARSLSEERSGRSAGRGDALRQHDDAGGGPARVPAGRRDHEHPGAGNAIRGRARAGRRRAPLRAQRRGDAQLPARRTTSTSSCTRCCSTRRRASRAPAWCR